MSLTFALAFICGLTARPAKTQTIVHADWIDGSGNWAGNTNWSCAPRITLCIPNNNVANSFRVGIDSPGKTVTLDNTSSPATVDTLDLQAGALSVGRGGSLTVIGDLSNGSSAKVDIANGGAVGVGSVNNSGSITLADASSGAGNKLTVSGSFTNNAGGELSLNAVGDMVTTSRLTNNGKIFVAAGAKLDAGRLTNVDFEGNLSGGDYVIEGTLSFNSNPFWLIASGTSLTLKGPQALIMAGRFHGVHIGDNQGTLILDHYSYTDNGPASQIINSGEVQLSDSSLTIGRQSDLGGFLNNFSLSPSRAQIDIEGGSTLTVHGDIGTSGQILMGVTQGANTFTVDTNINIDAEGSLKVEGQHDQVFAGGFNNAGDFSLGKNASLTVTGDGYGGIYKQTSGTTDVDGTLITPAMRINGGLLSGTGVIKGAVSVDTNGTLSPGDAPGTIHIGGALDFSGTLEEAIDSSSNFDVTDIAGELTLGSDSVLAIMLGTGFNPPPGTAFTIMNFGSLASGSRFGSIENQFFNDDTEEWNIAYNPTDIVLTVESSTSAPTPEPESMLLVCTGALGISLLRRQSKIRHVRRRI